MEKSGGHGGNRGKWGNGGKWGEMEGNGGNSRHSTRTATAVSADAWHRHSAVLTKKGAVLTKGLVMLGRGAVHHPQGPVPRRTFAESAVVREDNMKGRS